MANAKCGGREPILIEESFDMRGRLRYCRKCPTNCPPRCSAEIEPELERPADPAEQLTIPSLLVQKLWWTLESTEPFTSPESDAGTCETEPENRP